MPRIPHTRFDKAPGCAVEATLSLIGGKWKGVLLHHLFQNGTMRFNELKRSLPAITQRMLTNQLRELESDGLIIRQVFAVIPPRVEYSLSETGLTLKPVINALNQWGSIYFNHTLNRATTTDRSDSDNFDNSQINNIHPPSHPNESESESEMR